MAFRYKNTRGDTPKVGTTQMSSGRPREAVANNPLRALSDADLARGLKEARTAMMAATRGRNAASVIGDREAKARYQAEADRHGERAQAITQEQEHRMRGGQRGVGA